MHTTYRNFLTGGTGTPEGDRNKYHVLRNGEIDYDQAFTAHYREDSSIWMPPNQVLMWDLSNGFDTRYLLSVGPFDLEPGEAAPVVLAYVAGESLHTESDNIQFLQEAGYTPELYYENLNFSDLTSNAIIAGWVYDNPGVDSDSDGYAGEFRECNGEKYWYKGDGVPDYRASSPPPAPEVRAEALAGAIRVRWNGALCEIEKDVISRRIDFEGYNVYLAPDSPSIDLGVVATTDIENYYKYTWVDRFGEFRMQDYPYTVDSLRCLYASACNDSAWHPLNYPLQSPFIFAPDSFFYFAPAGCNTANLGWETPIVKTYPNAPKPDDTWIVDTTLIPPAERDDYLTAEGRFKYYEYEYVATNLFPGQNYWVVVTAFDHGTLLSTAPIDESSIQDGVVFVSPAAGPGYCCVGLAGDIDNDPNHVVDIGDLTRLIDYLYISRDPLACPGEGNLDGSPDGVVDIGDLTRLIGFLYLNAISPEVCR
jgi:hypothetical protein